MSRRNGAAALLALALQGCADVAVDADGTRHVTGFMRMALPPPAAAPGADAMRVQTLGLSLDFILRWAAPWCWGTVAPRWWWCATMPRSRRLHSSKP